MTARAARGFTLIEVLVALAIVAMGLGALMSAVSSTASASGYLRQKAQAQWIALNRLEEVRLNLPPGDPANAGASAGTAGGNITTLGGATGLAGGAGLAGGTAPGSAPGLAGSTGTTTGELDFANQHWHYDTSFFDTSVATMRRVVVRVWAGAADVKSNPLAEATGFLGADVSPPGGSNVDWTAGSTPPPANGTANNGKTAQGGGLPPAGSAAAGGGTVSGGGGLGSAPGSPGDGSQPGGDGGTGGSQ